MNGPSTEPRQLRPYLEAGWDLIPLHRWDAEDVVGGKRRGRGKSPLHANWTRRPFRSADQVAHMEQGNNVGVRLRADQLVVDVDPRNFADGDDPWARLCAEAGIDDPSAYPTVETGSGGLHVYMAKPSGISVRDSLPEYRGVEFKTLGRQVVAAGSVHPETRRTYAWDPLSDDLAAAPQAPAALIELARRPVAAAPSGGGEHTQEELASMLDALDPEDFRDHDRWLALMQACHHATAGDGRQEFIDWSTSDPDYADHGGGIGRRWDSLHADNDGARVTGRTLHKLLRDAGRDDVIPRPSAQEDFEVIESETGRSIDAVGGGEAAQRGDPSTTLVEEMNRTYCAALDGGAFHVFREEPDELFRGRTVWTRMSREAFRHYFEDETVTQFGSRRSVSKAELWLASPHRRKYPGIVMDPEGLPHNAGKLNLWRGWAVEPAPGDWSMMRELIGGALCDGDSEAEAYVLRWIACMLQRPWETPEVAIAFRGEEGTGKGTLGRALMRVAGQHGLTVSHRTQFAGRFNAHLRNCVFLFADEAVWPGDKEAEAVLKQLVTEPVLSYEAKGRDIT